MYQRGDINRPGNERGWRPEERSLPFSFEHPLLFHELTTLPHGQEGEEIFKDLLLDNAVLTPLALRDEEAWLKFDKKNKGKIFSFDIAAGDDEYLFFTPCHPLNLGSPLIKPAVAFDANLLVHEASRPGFRPTDLEKHYKLVMSTLLIDVDNDEENVHAASEELQAVASIMTRSGITPVMGLIKLYQDILFRESLYVDSFDLQKELDALLQPDRVADTVSWLFEEHGIEIDPGEEWVTVFGRMDKFPFVPLQPPEVVINCPVPLSEALFFRTASGDWVEMEEQEKKSLVANPLYVSPSERRMTLT